jgi:hypothetical protein
MLLRTSAKYFLYFWSLKPVVVIYLPFHLFRAKKKPNNPSHQSVQFFPRHFGDVGADGLQDKASSGAGK